MADPEERITITLLFIRCIRGNNRKKSWLYQEIDSSDNNGKPLDFKDENSKSYNGKNLCAGLQPGAILTVDARPNRRTIWPGTAVVVGQWENENDVIEWRSLDRAVQGEIESEQTAIKKVKRDLPAEYLEPFNKAYHACDNYKQRSQLLAWVIEEITTYRH